MAWLKDRLREDNTRSAIGQLSILVVVAALLLGVDVEALLTQAEASAGRLMVLLVGVAGAAAQVARLITPEKPPVVPVVPPEMAQGLAILARAVGDKPLVVQAPFDAVVIPPKPGR